MSDSNKTRLSEWITYLAEKLHTQQTPSVEENISFLKNPEFLEQLVDRFESLPDLSDGTETEALNYQSACILAFDICVAQLQSAIEYHNKYAEKLLERLMNYLAGVVKHSVHPLGFWLPILDAFYESQVTLSTNLEEAFMDLTSRDGVEPVDEKDYAQSIRELLVELSDLSDFDIAEHFFSQAHAMPAAFYMDLLLDLYSVEEGQDVGILFLLHPKAEVRTMVLDTLDHILPHVLLSDLSLTRLKMIQAWYPHEYAPYFQRWMKSQRKQGAHFLQLAPESAYQIYATELDGAGSQGLLIHLSSGSRRHKVCGVLYKYGVGIKDVWMTMPLLKKELKAYYRDVFDESVTLREVDLAYLQRFINHFLALQYEKNELPPLHLLELQIALGIEFRPERIEIDALIEELAVEITPFTLEEVEKGIKQTNRWFRDKKFTRSWFEEDHEIDACVNQCCSIVDGIKVCAIARAEEMVLEEVFEARREKWKFHFLWTALWAKACARHNERVWKDALFVAYAILSGRPLKELAIMQDICHFSVINSLETMQERRSHLNLSALP